ncbi:hypothetical protein As57867_008166, partial [Aphanomyces stellatus]
SISITNANAGTVFVQDRALSIQNLHLHAAGAGSIQWDVPTTVVAAAADLRTSDAGNVTLFASNLFLALEMKASTAGRGDIAISSANMTVLTHLVTDISGSGDVVYNSHGSGTCGDLLIKQMGPGAAYTSSITCINTSVVAASTGDVYVSSLNVLDVNQMGSGTVYLEVDAESRRPPSMINGHVHMLQATQPTVPSMEHLQVPPHVLSTPPTHPDVPPVDSTTQHEVVQFRNDFDTRVTALNLDCGRTFVMERPELVDTNAFEVVTPSTTYLWQSYGDSEDVVDGERTLTMVCTPANNSEPHYVNIYVSTQSIRKITSRADGDVVIYPNTLASSNTTNLTIQNAGSGNIFVQDSTVTAHTLSLHADTSGSIQWNVPTTVVAHTLDLQTAAAGSIFLFASNTLAAQSLVASAQASGSIAVSVSKIAVADLHTDVSGSGGIVYAATTGKCTLHAIKQMGSGNVYTSSISCVDTTVLAASSGDIFVAGTNSLDVNQMGSGNVYLQQLLPLPPRTSGTYRLLKTDPTAIIIPHVPVPPHVLDENRSLPQPDAPSIYGLSDAFSLCFLRNTKTKMKLTPKEAIAINVQPPTFYHSHHPPASHEQYQRQSQQRQQQLYNSHSGTINYVDAQGLSSSMLPQHDPWINTSVPTIPQRGIRQPSGKNSPPI